MRYYILDEKQNPVQVDVIAWAKWWRKNDRRVAVDTVGNVRISTVFLGSDHSFRDVGRPIIFETMVFGGGLDQECERTSTWNEAEVVHERMVERVKADEQRLRSK